MNENTVGCGLWFAVVIFNLTIGAWSVDKILSWFGKDISTIWDILIGLFVAQMSVPVAIIGSLLKWFGVF